MAHPRFDLPPATGYLVALSGGADSRLLLELTVRAVLERTKGGSAAARVVAVHLNHSIRGAEADRDEAFCRALCERLGVPLVVEQANIPARAAQSGRSEEAEARLARYDLFLRTMRERRLPLLLTAHNADDQLETLLHRLLRGSGTRGMGGIPPTRPLTEPDEAFTVARPLLGWTKREILAACEEMGLSYVTDSTNLEDEHTRNRLRHHVIPALETIAGEGTPQRAALRLSKAAREDEDALAAMALMRYRAARSRAACGEASPPTPGTVAVSSIAASAIAAEMPAIAKRMLALAYAEQIGSTSDTTLSAYHLDALLDLCRDGREGQTSDRLPAGVRAEIQNQRLIFRQPSPILPPLPPRPIDIGDTVWDEGSDTRPRILIRVEANLPPGAKPLADGNVWASAVFSADRLSLPLWVRAREPGDGILSHGMHKKIKKLLCEKHIPLHLRDRLPLFCTDGGQTPIWLPGVAFCDGYPPPTAGPCLRLTVYLGSPLTRGSSLTTEY